MDKIKLSKAQIDQLSFGKRTLIKGVLKYNVNVYDENSLQQNIDYIFPAFLGSNQEDFIYSKIYKGKNVEIELINVAFRGDYFIMAYNIYTDREDDEVHFLYDARDFSFIEVRYFEGADELEGVWH